MALFAAENKRFQESREMTAGDRAQIHLQRIRELSEQRQAELATLMLENS
jgi:acyl-CoA reductase-like NAD-dependent aldehyde dehydrogenase